jgi:hypothetical protein
MNHIKDVISSSLGNNSSDIDKYDAIRNKRSSPNRKSLNSVLGFFFALSATAQYVGCFPRTTSRYVSAREEYLGSMLSVNIQNMYMVYILFFSIFIISFRK